MFGKVASSCLPSCASSVKVEMVKNSQYVYQYRWILCLSAEEQLVALSDLSRQRGAGAMCEQAFRKHWCGGEAADSGGSQCAAPVLSTRWPSQVSIQYREHVSILALSQKLSCQVWRNILFWGKKKKQDKTNAFQMQSGVALNDEPR